MHELSGSGVVSNLLSLQEIILKAVLDKLNSFRENLKIQANQKSGGNSLASLTPMFISLTQDMVNMEREISTHLYREETVCLPVIQRFLSVSEMNSLVREIMGERSAQEVSNKVTEERAR